MFRKTLLIALLPGSLFVSSMTACDVEPQTDLETRVQTEDVTARNAELDYGTCVTEDANFCGGQSDHADGCWCDDQCEQYGDCCFDKPTSCDGVVTCLSDVACGEGQTCNTDVCIPACPPGVTCILGCFGACEDAGADSCADNCGEQAAGGCWCDDLCEQYGDCCDDIETACAEPDPNSCEGHCDEQADGGCWCDDQCEQYGDCCDDVGEFCAPEPEPPTCDEIVADILAERAAISSCTADAECGQALTGTSCGCTMNWVARADADTDDFYALQTLANEQGCAYAPITTCSCPPVDGFICDEGICNWNYTF
ncbi:MAG: hypothetical protein AAF799_19110 [Myxococcota bacterium]